MSWSHFDGATYRRLIEESGFAIVLEDEHGLNAFDDEDRHPIFLARAV